MKHKKMSRKEDGTVEELVSDGCSEAEDYDRDSNADNNNSNLSTGTDNMCETSSPIKHTTLYRTAMHAAQQSAAHRNFSMTSQSCLPPPLIPRNHTDSYGVLPDNCGSHDVENEEIDVVSNNV